MGTRRLMFAVAALLFQAPAVLACSTCGGDPDSNMVKGANAGVFVMMLVVYAVLFTMIGVVGAWAIRARRLNAPPCDSSDTGTHPSH